MEINDFDEKFDKLIKILTTDEAKAEEFSAIGTVDESFDYACSLVGTMDRAKYHEAVKKYISNVDFDDHLENNPSNQEDLSSINLKDV